MIWIVAVIACLALGCALVALYVAPWSDSFRAANWRRELSNAFQFGYLAGKADGERKRNAVK